jgi:hypothetical protein
MQPIAHSISRKSLMVAVTGMACLLSAPLRAQPSPSAVSSTPAPDSTSIAVPAAPGPDSTPIDVPAAARSETLRPAAYKSPATAVGLSVLATAAPIYLSFQFLHSSSADAFVYLFLGGIVIGPSTGQFYAGSAGTGALGMIIRGVGTGLFLSALVDAFPRCDDEETSCRGGGETKAVIGMAALAGGALYSLIDGALAAKRFNKRQLEAREFGWSPALSPGTDGAWTTGAVAWMRF